MIKYWAECNDCDERLEADDAAEAERYARTHANRCPGHQVAYFKEYLPDGGRDYLGRFRTMRITAPQQKGA